MDVEVYKVEDDKVFACPKSHLLDSFVPRKLSLGESLIYGFGVGVVSEAGTYLTEVYKYLIEKYPNHRIIFKKDHPHMLELYYEKAVKACGGMGLSAGVRVTVYKESSAE